MKTHKIIETHETKEIKEKTETSEDTSRNEMTQYPSAFLLLESAKDEYTKERERSSILDGKAAHFMTAILLVATIFIPINPFDKVVSVFQGSDCIVICATLLLLFILAVSFAILAYAFKRLYDAYAIREYLRFELENTDVEYRVKPNNIIASALCDHDRGIVENNIKVNNKKVEAVNKGVKACGIGFLLLSVSTICLKIVIGG